MRRWHIFLLQLSSMIAFVICKNSSSCNENKCVSSTYNCTNNCPIRNLADVLTCSQPSTDPAHFECRIPDENLCTTIKVRYTGDKSFYLLDRFQRAFFGDYNYLGIMTPTNSPVYRSVWGYTVGEMGYSFLAKDGENQEDSGFWRISTFFAKSSGVLNLKDNLIKSNNCSEKNVELCDAWTLGSFINDDIVFNDENNVEVECREPQGNQIEIDSTTQRAITAFDITSTEPGISVASTDFAATQSDNVATSSGNNEEDMNQYTDTPNPQDVNEAAAGVAKMAKMINISFLISLLPVLVTLKAVFI